jgi:hypothetical protein
VRNPARTMRPLRPQLRPRPGAKSCPDYPPEAFAARPPGPSVKSCPDRMESRAAKSYK